MHAIRTCWHSLLVAAALAAHVQAAEVWGTDLEAAKRIAAQTNRLVLVHFGAPWCQPCQTIERNVFTQPGFGEKLAANYVCVKLSVDDHPLTARKYGVQAIPTDVILAPDGQLLQRVASPQTAPEFLDAMNRAAALARNGQAPPPANAAPYAGRSQPAGPQTAPAAPSMVAAAGAAAAADSPGPSLTPAVGPAGPPPAGAPVANPHAAPSTDGRYADYFSSRRPTAASQPTASPPATTAPPATPGSATPPYEAPYAASPATPGVAPYSPTGGTPPSNAIAGTAPYASAPAAAMPEAATPPLAGLSSPATPAMAPYAASPTGTPGMSSPATTGASPPAPVGANAPIGLDGHCPVTLCEQQAWKPGDPRWGMQHRGRTYLFAGPEEQRRFSQNPDLYSPVMSGLDPVLLVDHGQNVQGSRVHGLFCGGHIYLFSSEETLERFMQNRSRYAAEALQARR